MAQYSTSEYKQFWKIALTCKLNFGINKPDNISDGLIAGRVVVLKRVSIEPVDADSGGIVCTWELINVSKSSALISVKRSENRWITFQLQEQK
jgi:hypothetical protein